MFHLTLPIGNGIGSSHVIPLQAQREGRGIAPTHLQASTSKKWVGLGGQSGWAQKVLPPLGFSLQAVQPIISHYADHSIPVATCW